MAKDTLVMDRKQLTALGENPDVPVLGAASALWFGIFTIAGGQSGRYKDYVAIAPLKGPDGVQQTPVYPTAYSGDAFNLTKSCKYPAAAIRWADWFYSMEGTLISQTGVENKGWRKAEPGEKSLTGEQAIWSRLAKFGSTQNECYTNTGLYCMDEEIRLGMSVEGESDETEKILYDATKNLYEPYGQSKNVPELFFTREESVEFSELQNQISSELKKSLASFISGEKSLDSDWDEYISRLNDMGLKRYLELYQQVYDKNYK